MNRGALNLLSVYGDDTSDEEVPIGRVSMKRCLSIENINTKSLCRTTTNSRLPVPELLNEKVSLNSDPSVDNPSLHNGRVRSFPHERGNWVTYVYVPYKPADDTIVDLIMDLLKSHSELPFFPVNNLHLSVTKTVVLKHHWIDSFMKSVREKLSCIRKFVLILDSLKVYCNEERSRTFIALKISSAYDTLTKIVEYLNECLSEFRLPTFYIDPSFHISIASCVGDYEEDIKQLLPRFNQMIQEKFVSNNWYSYITHLECKCGNKLFTFDLC